MARDIDYPQGCLPIENNTNMSQQIERLRKLSGCLHEFQNSDEDGSPSRFGSLFLHLSQKCFLDNSNPDFRILLSNCLASILRIQSPDFPTADVVDLKDAYLHIFRSFKGLGEFTTDSPQYKQYFTLLETVHYEKFLTPLSEMKDSDEKEATSVYRALMRGVLAAPCCKGWGSNVRRKTRQIEKESGSGTPENFNDEDEEDEETDTIDDVEELLVEIAKRAIGQLDFVPNEVLDILFYHVIQPQRTNFPAARYLAESVIKACLDKPHENTLDRSIQNVMTSASKEGKFPESFLSTGSNNRTKFFEVLQYLHFINAELVSGAVQELNFWLQSENEEYRKEAVKIVGMLTRDSHCQLGDSNDVTWAAFMQAEKDTADSVRKEFVEQAKEILMSSHSLLRYNVMTALIRLCKDVCEDVRLTVLETVSKVAKSKLDVINDRLLFECAERMKDRKPKVRELAFRIVSELYKHVMTSRPLNFYSIDDKVNESAPSYTDSEKETVKFIPNHIFSIYRHFQRNPMYINERLMIERYLQKNLVPYQESAEKRVEMLMSLWRGLDEYPEMMFADVIGRSSQIRRSLIGIVNQASHATETSSQVKDRIRRLCQIFPEPTTLEKVMMTFVNELCQNNETLELVKNILNDKNTTAESEKYVIAFKGIMEVKINRSQQRTFRHFVDRISPLSFDVLVGKELTISVAKTVVAADGKDKEAETHFAKDLSLLKLFTDNYAHIFADEKIVSAIRSDMLHSDEPIAVETAIQALTKILTNSAFKQKMDDELTRKEKWYLLLIKDLKDFVTRDEPELRRSCKLATRLLTKLLSKEKVIEFFDSQINNLLNRLYLDCRGVANAFQVLAEIFCTNPSHYFSSILEVLESDKIGSLIMISHEYSDEDPVEFNEQIHFEKQPWPKYTMAKVYAAKFAAKVLSVFSSLTEVEEKRRMDTAAQKLIDLLCEVVEKKGELGDRQCDVEKARIRSAAAGCLLQLASLIPYRVKFNTRLFKNMSYMITDEAYCVRLYYVQHVKKRLSRQLPIEFAACYGLTNLGAVEEKGENKLEGFKAICSNHAHQAFAERSDTKADLLKITGTKKAVFCAETVIAYVVWLLANYHKFEKVEKNAQPEDSEDVLAQKIANVNLLAELQESLWLIIDSLKIAKCNMQKVWKVLEKLKTFGDKSIRTDTRISMAQVREHNKKLWALCDLGITMMLYRAKLQNEDQEFTDNGFNLQFFYVCNEKDKADPSNVYAPDILINDEKQRNGKAPKAGRIFQVADLKEKFEPPAQNNESAASTSLKNVSRKGKANTSANKTKYEKGTKRRSGGAKLSDEDVEAITETPPVVKKTRSKRGTYDLPEEEEDDDAVEIIPLPKRRGAPVACSEPTSSSGTSKKSGTESLKNRNSEVSNGRQTNKEDDEIEEASDTEVEGKEKDVSLDNLVISPILNESSGRSRRSARTIAATATITASTPMVITKPKTLKRKRPIDVGEISEEGEEVEGREVEPVDEVSSSKGKNTGKRSHPTSKKTLTSPVKKTTTAKRNGASLKKNKYGLPVDEDEGEEQEEQIASTSMSSLRTRTSTRLSKK